MTMPRHNLRTIVVAGLAVVMLLSWPSVDAAQDAPVANPVKPDKPSEATTADSSKEKPKGDAPPVKTPVAKQGNATYLDDLKEVKFSVGNGTLAKHGETSQPAKRPQKFRLDGKVLKHALSLHPPNNGSSYVIYKLNNKSELFQGTVALNKPTEGDGLEDSLKGGFSGKAAAPLRFRILGDGKNLWESEPIQKHGDSQDFEIAIAGVKELRLEVVCRGNSSWAWAFWGNPRIIEKLVEPDPPRTSAPSVEVSNGGDESVKFVPLELPGPVTFMAATEDGQFLVCSHQSANQISVWDVAAGNVARTLNLPAPRSILCRGDSIFVAHATEGNVRWLSRKADWKLVNEFVVSKAPIRHLSAAQGEYFHGDLVVSCHGPAPGIIHLETMKDKSKVMSGGSLVTVGYDGKLVLSQSWLNHDPAGGFKLFTYADYLAGNPKPIVTGGEPHTPYLHQSQAGMFWSGGGMVFGGVSVQKFPQPTGELVIPDVAQPVFYSLTPKRLRAQRFNATLEEFGSRAVTWAAKPADSSEGVFRSQERHRNYLLDIPYARSTDGKLRLFVMNQNKGVVWSAETSAFALVPSDDRVTASDVNKLALPARIPDGLPFTVKISGPAGAEYELIKGPVGMELTKGGELAWTPDKASVGSHELKFRVTSGSDVSIGRHLIEVIDHELIEKSGGTMEAVDKGQRLTLELDHYQLTPGADYRSLLLLQGDVLRTLGPDGLTVTGEQKLPRRYLQIAARRGDAGEISYVALSRQPLQLDVIDGRSGKVRKSIPIEKTGVGITEVMDFELHPRLPVTFVPVKQDQDWPRYRILVVDEASGKIETPDNGIGTWVKVDPNGQYLYAGYSDTFRGGIRIQTRPGGNRIQIPQFGDMDCLATYELRGQKLRLLQVLQEAGGKGAGIVLSADGKRITYQSQSGSPAGSRNLLGWNPKKLKEAPVNYFTKDRGSTQIVAFHPTLNLVAVPGGGSAVLFDRETGKLVDNKLRVTTKGLGGANVDQLLFSPNGRSLVFVCNDRESGRYLRIVDLKLSAEEVDKAAKGIVVPVEAPQQLTNLVMVNRDEINALQPGAGESLSHAEISRRFLNSVVVITSDEGSGSGFVVGSKGFILTCAHVLPEEGEVTVTYNAVGLGQPKTVIVKAEAVRIDRERDLALLKISPKEDFTTISPTSVALANGDSPCEVGEDVTVIGNPGMGDKILKQTVTTGVVSSTEREIEGQKYIQTSAAVNAGNSGGPVFGAKGQVIGLVVLKARLEGTAFAVPAGELRKFLHDATEITK